MHALEEKILEAKKSHRPAIVPFLTANFPDREKFWKHLEELDKAGADIIEIGVPFSDPVADGPVIEEASRRVLEKGANLKEILKGLSERKFRAGIVLMGYMNPFLQYGLEELARDAKNAGVNGFIIPDLPYEEEDIIKPLLERDGMALIPLVGPNTPPDRMEKYAKDAKGYVYVVSVMGVTGERDNVSKSVSALLKRVKNIFTVPAALGFGLRHPSQLAELEEKPDAAIFGSALVTWLDAGKPAAEFIKPWLQNNAA